MKIVFCYQFDVQPRNIAQKTIQTLSIRCKKRNSKRETHSNRFSSNEFLQKNRQNKYWPDKYVCLSRIDYYSTLVNSLIYPINSFHQKAPKQNHEYIEFNGLLWCDHISKVSVINARSVNNSKLVFISKKKKEFVIVSSILVCFF